jgi:hypothetical protein
MASNIRLKKSVVKDKVPLKLDLDYGELALNYRDGKLYFKESDGVDSNNDTIQYFYKENVISITKPLTITTDWQDTGIKSTDLETGTYIVQLYANDSGIGGSNVNEYYSGVMSWYSGNTDSSLELPTDEIVLHRAGGGGQGALYLRTYRTPTANPDNLKLQIYSNTSNPSSSNYVFKFKKMI